MNRRANELVTRIHEQAVDMPEKFSKNAELLDVLMKAADAIKELMRRCEQFQYMPPPAWIPVTERLPEFDGAVLCMRKSNVYGVRPHQEILYVDEYGFKNYDDIYLADGVVTHWMPLPEPPKEE